MLKIGVGLFYYKLGKAFLQIRTKWGSYYKSEQNVLQVRVIITNCGITNADFKYDNIF